MRVSSAPTTAPEPAPVIPPQRLPRISLFPATSTRSRESVGTSSMRPGTQGSSATFGAASLRRQRSVPLYHRALTEQVERERDEIRGAEAVRLGVPVIGVIRPEESEERRKSDESEISTEISFGSHEEEAEGSGTQPRLSGGGGGGNNNGQGSGERGGRLLHSTRASSGVFPEGRESRDEEEDDEGGEEEEIIHS